MTTIKLMTTAMSVLALAAAPLAVDAKELPMPQYKQAIGCAGYYTVLHFYANNADPSSKSTAMFKGFATDWLKLAALLRQPSDDLEGDFEKKQQAANTMINDDDRAAELAEVQTYCRTNGMAHFKWG